MMTQTGTVRFSPITSRQEEDTGGLQQAGNKVAGNEKTNNFLIHMEHNGKADRSVD
jgi:hypothetical protein